MRIEAGTVWINQHMVFDPGVTVRREVLRLWRRAWSGGLSLIHGGLRRLSKERILMKNKIALEEHFSIDGMTYKNDVMDAPTFAEVRRRLGTQSHFE
jgi:hypothetical protein